MEKMIDKKISTTLSWREEYDRLKDILSQIKTEIILKLLHKAEKEVPELYATIENPNPTQPYPEPGHYCGD